MLKFGHKGILEAENELANFVLFLRIKRNGKKMARNQMHSLTEQRSKNMKR